MSLNNDNGAAEKAMGPKLHQSASASSVRDGEHEIIEDGAIRDFYGSAVNESYRLKSELVAEHLAGIGTGKSVTACRNVMLSGDTYTLFSQVSMDSICRQRLRLDGRQFLVARHYRCPSSHRERVR
jgi:hypothetical protein